MRNQILPAVRMVLVMTVLTGLLYPLLITGFAQVAAPGPADGSLVVDADGAAVGSAWVGQSFTQAGYLQSRPSATDYDGAASGGSSLGPTNEDLLAAVAERVVAYREDNGLAGDATVPVDAVTASGSGWDPHISPANAALQAARVAEARGVAEAVVLEVIEANTQRPPGFLGEAVVDVLGVNVALDART